jgi:hypothetical protein
MTRAFLALTLWSLCLVVGLWSTRVTAENTEKGQRLYEKFLRLIWSHEVNTDLANEIEGNRYADRRAEEQAE